MNSFLLHILFTSPYFFSLSLLFFLFATQEKCNIMQFRLRLKRFRLQNRYRYQWFRPILSADTEFRSDTSRYDNRLLFTTRNIQKETNIDTENNVHITIFSGDCLTSVMSLTLKAFLVTILKALITMYFAIYYIVCTFTQLWVHECTGNMFAHILILM